MQTSFKAEWLPEQAPDELRHFMYQQPELVAEMPFRRVSIAPDIGEDFEVFTPYDYEIFCHAQKNRTWAAECICPHCGDTLYFEWGGAGNGAPYLWVVQGEDGAVYESIKCNKHECVKISSGDEMQCPHCGESVVLMHVGKYGRSGSHRFQVAAQSTELINGYTVLMSWIASRDCTKVGHMHDSMRPTEAIVVTEHGRLQRYIHEVRSGFAGRREEQLNAWEKVNGVRDYLQVTYNSYACANGRCCGGYIFTNPRSASAGTTGEKTGLLEYLDAGGRNPAMYLMEWNRHKNIENLMKSAVGKIVVDKIEKSLMSRYRYGASIVGSVNWYMIDLKKSKPHEMLYLSRAELRELVEKKLEGKIDFIVHAKKVGLTFSEAVKIIDILRQREGDRLLEIAAQGGAKEARTVMRYIFNRKNPNEALMMLLDCWSWIDLENASHGRKYPRDLRAAHDAERVNNRNDGELYKQAGFEKILEKYGGLEWTYGDLCVVLPHNNGDLISEGKTLNHCVGRYADSHIAEKAVVFFVRHSRGPDRSWYTMDYDFMGKKPVRNQLHGYGNEMAYKDGSFVRLRIPAKVKEFVELWEQEILFPFFGKKHKKAS